MDDDEAVDFDDLGGIHDDEAVSLGEATVEEMGADDAVEEAAAAAAAAVLEVPASDQAAPADDAAHVDAMAKPNDGGTSRNGASANQADEGQSAQSRARRVPGGRDGPAKAEMGDAVMERLKVETKRPVKDGESVVEKTPGGAALVAPQAQSGQNGKGLSIQGTGLRSSSASQSPAAAPVPPIDAPERTAASAPLPPNWKTRESRSGETYYYNTITRETTWDRPEVAENEKQLPPQAPTSSADESVPSREKYESMARSHAEPLTTSIESGHPSAISPNDSTGGIRILGAAKASGPAREQVSSPQTAAPNVRKRSPSERHASANTQHAPRAEITSEHRFRSSRARIETISSFQSARQGVEQLVLPSSLRRQTVAMLSAR